MYTTPRFFLIAPLSNLASVGRAFVFCFYPQEIFFPPFFCNYLRVSFLLEVSPRPRFLWVFPVLCCSPWSLIATPFLSPPFLFTIDFVFTSPHVLLGPLFFFEVWSLFFFLPLALFFPTTLEH